MFKKQDYDHNVPSLQCDLSLSFVLQAQKPTVVVVFIVVVRDSHPFGKKQHLFVSFLIRTAAGYGGNVASSA